MSYFSAKELKCKCGRKECDAEPVSITALMKMNMLRILYGSALILNSVRRCLYWNTHEKGAPKSQHLLGKAFDIRESDRANQEQLAALAEKIGFGGIFFYPWGLHVDDGPSGRRGDFR